MLGMDEWKSLITQANKAFHAKNFACAVELNKRALRHAANIFEDYIGEEPDNAVMAIIVSYLNQAEAYEQADQFDKTCCLYERAYQFVSSLMKDEQTQSHVRLAAMKGSSCVLIEWMQFLNRQHENISKEDIKRYKQLVACHSHYSEPSYH